MALEMVQIGVESASAHGTAVAADTIVLGKITYVPDQVPTIPEDDIGKKVKGYRGVLTSGKLVNNTLSIERGYFQVLPLLFSMLLKGGVTAAEQTTGQGDYLWDFTPDLDSTNALDSCTIEFGDSVQAFENEYLTGEKIKISVNVPQDGSDAAVKIDYDFFARQNTKCSFTASLVPPTVNEMNGLLAQLYVDTSWANIGTTEKTGILRSAEIEIVNGAYPLFHGGTALTFDGVGEGKIAVLCTLTLDNGSEAIALHDAKGSKKYVKLLLSGPAIGSGGDNHSLDIEFSGVVMEPIPGASKDKETSLTTVSLEGVYDVTGDKLLVVKATTNVAAI